MNTVSTVRIAAKFVWRRRFRQKTHSGEKSVGDVTTEHSDRETLGAFQTFQWIAQLETGWCRFNSTDSRDTKEEGARASRVSPVGITH